MMRRARKLIFIFVLLLTLGGKEMALGAEEQPVYVGLLVGSQSYQGDRSLPALRFADDDVLRFAETIRPLVHPQNLALLVDPDEEVASELSRIGIERWTSPSRSQFIRKLKWLESSTRLIRRERGEGVEVRVLLFISAHGDALGIHLADGVLRGQELQAYLDDLTADSVLLIADACFSAQWLALKGDGGVDSGGAGNASAFPIDAVAEAVRDLERVGTVTSQSVTREERSVVQGGLVTHVVSCALQGAADLDQDRRISYDELAAFLRAYGQRNSSLERVLVHSPRRAPENPPMLVDLNALNPMGFEFPKERGKQVHCYWITDASDRLVSEFCKRQDDERRLSLPAGRYRVQRFDSKDAWYGREGSFRVAYGFVSVRPESFTGYWLRPGGKGGDESERPPAGARELSEAEAAYRATSPFSFAVDWRQLEGSEQWSIRGGVGGAFIGAQGPLTEEKRKDSLTQEKFARELLLVGDRRFKRLSGGYLKYGLEAGLGLSFGNSVGYDDGEVTVGTLTYRARLGWERPRGRWGFSLGLSFGGITAIPWSGSASDGSEGLEAYRMWLGGSAALALEAYLKVSHGYRILIGLQPLLIVEPHLIGNASQLEPYGGLAAFVGLGW